MNRHFQWATLLLMMSVFVSACSVRQSEDILSEEVFSQDGGLESSIQLSTESLFKNYFDLLTYLATQVQDDSLYIESDEFDQLTSELALIESDIEHNLENLSDEEVYDIAEAAYQQYLNEGGPGTNYLTCLSLLMLCYTSGGGGRLCMLIYRICTEIGPPNPNWDY